MSLALCPGLSVTGRLRPVRLKPAPVTLAALIVSADEPEEVIVMLCAVAEVFTGTLPNAMLLALRLRPAPLAGFIRNVNIFESPNNVAVTVAVCADETAATVTVKLALAELAATVTLAGTVTAGLSLLKAIFCWTLFAVSIAVQVIVPGPVTNCVSQ